MQNAFDDIIIIMAAINNSVVVEALGYATAAPSIPRVVRSSRDGLAFPRNATAGRRRALPGSSLKGVSTSRIWRRSTVGAVYRPLLHRACVKRRRASLSLSAADSAALRRGWSSRAYYSFVIDSIAHG